MKSSSKKQKKLPSFLKSFRFWGVLAGVGIGVLAGFFLIEQVDRMTSSSTQASLNEKILQYNCFYNQTDPKELKYDCSLPSKKTYTRKELLALPPLNTAK